MQVVVVGFVTTWVFVTVHFGTVTVLVLLTSCYSSPNTESISPHWKKIKSASMLAITDKK